MAPTLSAASSQAVYCLGCFVRWRLPRAMPLQAAAAAKTASSDLKFIFLKLASDGAVSQGFRHIALVCGSERVSNQGSQGPGSRDRHA